MIPTQGVQTISHIFRISLLFFLFSHGVTAWAQNVTTLTPTPFSASGDLAVAADGNIFVADFGTDPNNPDGDKVHEVTPAGEVSEFTQGLSGGTGNTFDGQGNLYQSSFNFDRIDRISPSGQGFPFAGASQGISGPFGLTFDSQGNLFVANRSTNSIVKITPAGNSTIFSQSALLDSPTGLTSDDQDNLYISNSNNGDIIKLTPAGQASLFTATSDPGTGSNGHIIFANERLYVAGSSSHQVFELSLAGKLKVLAGTGIRGVVDGPLLEASFSRPNGIDVSPDGRLLYVNDSAVAGDFSPNVVRVIELPQFNINAAISDAWFFPDTAGQGFFIIVWEDSKLVFLAWFTYDTERPPEDVMAILGEPGHRWLTALGPFDGNTALLDTFLSSGMIFDSSQPPVTTEQLEGATIEIVWSDCKTGLVKYNIPTLGLMGEIPIERIVEDKVAACETAQAQ